MVRTIMLRLVSIAPEDSDHLGRVIRHHVKEAWYSPRRVINPSCESPIVTFTFLLIFGS